jgi:class 3 adenylate cyclase
MTTGEIFAIHSFPTTEHGRRLTFAGRGREHMTEDAAEEEPKSLRHELRAPINRIVGYSEKLAEKATSEGHTRYVADLEKIGIAARDLLAKIESLPLDGLAGSSAPAAGAKEAAASERPSRVLVVDDIEWNRSMLAQRLERKSYRVDTADGGAEAIEKIRSASYDIVLLDIMMPEVSGYDVLREVRKTRSPFDLPIIMATAKDQGEDIVSAFKLGANDYVVKPIDFAVALVRIETQLSRKRAMEEARRLTAELERHNQFIRKTFGRYLSKEVVENLLSSPEGLRLGGEKRPITIMMSDLRGFSRLSEQLDPEQVVTVLNNYLGKMAEIVGHHNGTIDEFIGDAVLALFGAPIRREDDAERAIVCALRMQLAMREVNEENLRNGLPELEMGIALNTGECVVGNIGSHERAKYGVVGSPVNLTNRIESYTAGGQILVSKATVDAVGAELKLGDELQLRAKGFRELVTVYELLGIGGPHNLELQPRSEERRSLVREIPVAIELVQGEHVTGDAPPGKRVELSMCQAESTRETGEPG